MKNDNVCEICKRNPIFLNRLFAIEKNGKIDVNLCDRCIEIWHVRLIGNEIVNHKKDCEQ